MRIRHLVLLAVGLAAVSPVRSQSLWKAGTASLAADKKAQKVGDLVTILIVESSSASQQASTSVSKKDSSTANAGTGPLLKLLPAMGYSGSSSADAAGSTSRTSTLDGKITCKVTQILPNGNFVVEGSRDVKANDETQTLKVTGTVRPEDIQPDNTIQSTYIADAKIDYSGKGPIAERQKPGLINRLFRFLF